MQYSSLSNLHISQCIETLSEYLESTGLKKADCIRLSFAIEEALLRYQECFGEEIPFALVYGKKWARDHFSISIKGEMLNPFEEETDEETPSITQNIMQKMGFFPEWKYTHKDGNTLSMVLPKVTKAPLQKLLLSVVAAALFYGITLFLPEATRELLHADIFTPISNAFIAVLSFLSGPIIFASILCSIINMGDIATFGKIGRYCIAALFCTIVIVTVVSCFWLIFLFPIQSGSITQGLRLPIEILNLLLDMVPTNIFIFSLTDANPMQSVLLASFLGICILGLQKEVPLIASFANQCNLVLQCAMAYVTSYIHIFVFFCIGQLLLANQLKVILSSYHFFLFTFISLIVMFVFDLLRVWKRTGCKPAVFIEKMLPTFLIGLTLDSSAAAFTTNLNTCKNEYGIDDKLVEFALPFGQVIYMPGLSIFMVVLAFFLHNIYDVSLTGSTIFMIFFVAIILCIATPPMPGGGGGILSVMFAQLALPDEGLGIAIVFLTIFASTLTAFQLFGLHTELICMAKSLNLVNVETLCRKPKKRKRT